MKSNLFAQDFGLNPVAFDGLDRRKNRQDQKRMEPEMRV